MKEAKKVTAENQKDMRNEKFCENCRVKKAINHLAKHTADSLNFELAGKFGWNFVENLLIGFQNSIDNKEAKFSAVFLCYLLIFFDKDELVDFIQAFVMHNATCTKAFVQDYIAESKAIIKDLEDGKFYDC